MSVLAMAMSLNIFPWDALSELSEGFKRAIYSIQFPYRFLVMVTISLSFLGCGLYALLMREGKGKRGLCFAVSILLLTVFGSSFYLNHEIQGCSWSNFREAAAMGSGMIGNGEYLPAETDTSQLPYTQASAGEGVKLREYEKRNAHAEFYCENERSEAGYVECNLLYYPGYLAICGETGEELTIVPGENNVLRVEIPPGFTGSVEVDFAGKSYWKAGNMISAVLWLGMLFVWRNRANEKSKMG